MTREQILSKFTFFTKSSREFQQEILESAIPVSLPLGAYYLQQGDVCDNLALIGSGVIRVFKIGETGREITLYNVFAGEVCLLNVSCLLSGLASPATARVEEAVTALAIPQPKFRKWMAESEAMREFIFGAIASRFAAVTSLVEEIAFKKMDQRLSAYLIQRFTGDGSSRSEITATHEQIAADLGTAREVVSRLLKELERQEAVGLSRGRIQLKNETVLRSSAREL